MRLVARQHKERERERKRERERERERERARLRGASMDRIFGAFIKGCAHDWFDNRAQAMRAAYKRKTSRPLCQQWANALRTPASEKKHFRRCRRLNTAVIPLNILIRFKA